MNNKIIIIALFVSFLILLITSAIYQQKSVKESGKKMFVKFYSSNLNGYIEDVGIQNHGTSLKLINHPNFTFYPYTDNLLNDGNIFNKLAEYGDKVIKEPYSDTLILIKKDGAKYKYTFLKIQ